MEGLRQVFLDFTSFGAGQSGSSEMDSAKFVKLAKVGANRVEKSTTVVAPPIARRAVLQRNARKKTTKTIQERVLRYCT